MDQASMFVWNKLIFMLSLGLLQLLSISLGREHANSALIALTLVEIHHAIGKSEQSVVLTLADVLAREVLVTALAHDDVTCSDLLTTPDLHA